MASVARVDHTDAIIAAAHRLIEKKGETFTTQELIKEAGVALQTFYRRFGGKDMLLIAVIEAMITQRCVELERVAQDIDDPVARLRLYVTSSLDALRPTPGAYTPRFITSEHWRLHQIYPEQMAAATKPFADLVQRALVAAQRDALLTPRDPERDAWLITTIVTAAFHHYAFLPDDPAVDTVAEDVWHFCLGAVGGAPRGS
jgi:AcrR family transcriptional regulator